MKKIVCMLLIGGLFGFALGQTAEESPPPGFAKEDNPGYVETLIDFNDYGNGSRFADPFNIENWVLTLDETVNFVKNKNLTYVKTITDKGGKKNLGVRVNFPKVPIDTFAYLKPVIPFPFVSSIYSNKGVLDNVKIIKKMRLKMRSNIYPYRVYVVLQDKNGVKTKYRFNKRLDYFGWRVLEWNNAAYERVKEFDVGAKRDSVYPNDILPGVRLDSFIFEKNKTARTTEGNFNGKIGTDFIAYIKDVEITYDKAVDLRVYENDEEKAKSDYIDNEANWGIESEAVKAFEDQFANGLFARYKLDERMRRARRNLYTPPEADKKAGSTTDQSGDTSAAGNNANNQQGDVIQQVQDAATDAAN